MVGLPFEFRFVSAPNFWDYQDDEIQGHRCESPLCSLRVIYRTCLGFMLSRSSHSTSMSFYVGLPSCAQRVEAALGLLFCPFLCLAFTFPIPANFEPVQSQEPSSPSPDYFAPNEVFLLPSLPALEKRGNLSP